ncbi:MAG: M28 family peptidase [Solirubrobacterales bacterium]
MFSLTSRPGPHASDLAPDAFSGVDALADTREFVQRFPDRQAGSPGDAGLGDLVATRFRALGLETTRQRFFADVDGREQELSNVIGRLRGRSDREVVIMAHRDSAGRLGAASASGTAVLLELTQALDALDRSKTIVVVSSDGATVDAAGARRFADHYPGRGKVDVALVIDDIGATDLRRPFVLPWSTDSRRASLVADRTVEAALRRETGATAGSESWLGQFVRLAWPLTLREQGPLVSAGLDAVTLTARGGLPRGPGADTLPGVSADRLTRFGRAGFASVLAFDSPRFRAAATNRDLVLGRNVLPSWSLGLLAAALTLPALAAAIDAVARGRRRRAPVGEWLAWALGAAVAFGIAALGAIVFELVNWLPGSIEEAVAPSTAPSFGEAAPALAALGLLLTLAWITVRRLFGGDAHLRDIPSGAAAVALMLAIEVLVVCALNPYAGLLLVPAAHLALLTALPERPRRSMLAPAILAGGLVLPALALLYYGARLDLGLSLDSYALMLVSAFSGSLASVVVGSLLAGTLASAVIVTLSAGRREPPSGVTVRGPVTYAGPGSLGGTESALRR